jgi:hypothetical protein
MAIPPSSGLVYGNIIVPAGKILPGVRIFRISRAKSAKMSLKYTAIGAMMGWQGSLRT